MKHEPMIHIVDDDDAVRDALYVLMCSQDIPAQTYASAEDFLDQHAQFKLGCLLLDVRMPGMNGLQLLKELNKQNISIPVIFITGHGDVTMAVEAMKAGAIDFIEKPFDNEYLLNRVNNCLSECLNINNTNEQRQQIEAMIETLTSRERQVMELLLEGKQNKVIARELDISPRTVELHRAKVMKKLDAHSLSDIIRIALFSGQFKLS